MTRETPAMKEQQKHFKKVCDICHSQTPTDIYGRTAMDKENARE
jgi:hypothetical protein